MSKYETAIREAVLHWNSLPSEVFTSIYKRGSLEVVLIKFRETTSQRDIFNEIEPWVGIKFIDVLGTRDYFLGEFILINKKLWQVIANSQSIILKSKNNTIDSSKAVEKIRDDGFIRTYKTTNESLVIAKV